MLPTPYAGKGLTTEETIGVVTETVSAGAIGAATEATRGLAGGIAGTAFIGIEA